ncbi:MAG: ABC transporter substrate-binding protein [Acidimicrobiales bacterium]
MNHPWVISVPALSYSTEALLWGDYILAKYGKGITVAGLVNNNEFGAAYRVAFEKWAKDNGVTFKYELHDPQAASVTNEMTTLAATNADVVVLMTAGNFCTMGIKAVAESSWRPKERLVSNTCNGLTFFKPAGAAAEGWVSVSDRKDVSDPADQKDPKIAEFRDILSKAGLDPNNTTIGGGIGQYGWSMVDLLQRASKLPGGLSRTNAMLAARSVNTVHPYFRDGIKYRMNGNKDAYPIEGAITVRWTIPPGQENGSNVPFGTLKDLDGQTPNCAWDGKTCKDG